MKANSTPKVCTQESRSFKTIQASRAVEAGYNAPSTAATSRRPVCAARM